MIVKRFLFCNLEHKTPAIKVENGYKKHGRGVLGLVFLAFFGVFFGGTVWGQTITDVAGLNAMTPTGNYVIGADFDASGYTASIDNFSGTLEADVKTDGTFYTISGLNKPLFNSINGGTVRNVMLKDVHISQAGNVGAIACSTTGATRIYNCGILPNNPQYTDTSYVKSVETKGYCGSLVGLLDGTARVINCFSFANIKGGTKVAGIVGYNNTSNATQDNYDTKTIVMNCMFYGEIDTTQCDFKGSYPVYGGNIIKNDGNKAINNYNYYCAASKFDSTYGSERRYNCSWPAKVERLRRFEYYRSILNSNRRLCAFWVTDHNVSQQTSADTALIAKWVLDPSIAPYPVLKKWGKYPSIINIDSTRVWDSVQGEWVQRTNAAPYRGKKLGELTVTIKTGAHPGTVGQSVINNESRTLVITDMDTTSYDYCYGKVQLPYFNEVFGNPNSDDHTTRYHGNYTDSVVTGWKITSVTTMNGYNDTICFEGPWDNDGTRVRYRKKANAWESGFNYADRKCTSKDLYVTTGRVFAQGGYYYVPDSVTAITIEAYWGKAFYLQAKDNYLDRVDVAKTKNYGSPFTPAGTLPTSFSYSDGNTNHSINIYNDFATIMTDIKENKTCNVYDQALVLLSNYPFHAENDFPAYIRNDGKGGVTFMSADLDLDNEPDFCFPLQWRKADSYTRWPIMPFRFDFLPIPELGMAMRHDKFAYSTGIVVPTGHFEITETAFIYTTQFEYMSSYTVSGNPINHQKPLILNGGQYEQIVCHSDNGKTLTYTSNIIMGGHIWMKRFTPGSHTGRWCVVRHCAVSVMGGDYPEFYLSGLYRSSIDTERAYNDSPHCYTNGGRFGIMASAATESVKKDVVFKIDHSIIREFYGGGCNAANPVEGNINVTIDHSLVLDKYCGGPKVGEMQPDKDVITNATGTHFLGDFFGGGNGGTNLYRDEIKDETPSHMPVPNAEASQGTPNNEKWDSFYGFNNFKPVHGGNINSGGSFDESKGYYAEFEFEVFNQSNGLSEHTVARTYYHWAQFGATRTGNITNTLTDCTVGGNFYGGGNLGNVGGHTLGTKTVESVLTNATVYGNVFGAGYSASIPTFSAQDKSTISYPHRDAAGVVIPASMDYIKDEDGNVIQYKWCYKDPETGAVIPEDVQIPETVNTTNPTFEYRGHWYCLTTKSLDNLGAVSGDVTLTIKGKSTVGTLENGVVKHGTGNVYGGGDESTVGGGTVVKILDRTRVFGNIYGGGNRGTVTGDTKVIINGEVPETPSGTGNSGTNN
jgi:hypothetical protein